MANITGTNGKDTLTGTAGDDTILGLAGDDTIIASGGSDFIDGGSGNDTVDYSNNAGYLNIQLDSSTGSLKVQHPNTISDLPYRVDTLVNIETIIAKPNTIYGNLINFFNSDSRASINVDLSKNRLTYSLPSETKKTLTVKNFTDIFGTDGNDRFKGNDLNNSIYTGLGNDVVIGSKGNDSLNSAGNATVDYSGFDRAVKITAPVPVYGSTGHNFKFTVDKSGFGIDSVTSFQRIIGATNQDNTIDGSRGYLGGLKLDVNLTKNSMQLQTSDVRYGMQIGKFEVTNFVNVIGTNFNDTIVGGNKNSTLTGGGGNDVITGGSKNDIITGSDRSSRGFGEVDTLTGGGGKNKFVLGDSNGAFYVGKGNNDYALITDFNLFQDSIDLGGFKNYSFALEGTNTIDLYSGKDVNTRDLIAKIQIASGISSVAGKSRSVMSADASLNAIVAKMDILSGNESERDA